MAQTSHIQNCIDEIKEKMSNEVYLELCNKMKDLHKNETNKKLFYDISVVIPDFYSNKVNEHIVLSMKVKRFIIQLSMSDYERIRNDVQENGSTDLHVSYANDMMKTTYFCRYFSHKSKCPYYDEDDEADGIVMNDINIHSPNMCVVSIEPRH